jgi:hypothetical protein
MSLSGRHDSLATGIGVVQATNRANITGIIATNDATGPIFLQIFDAIASTITLGSSVADMTIKLPTTGSVSLDFHGAKFDTGLAYAVATTSTGSTAAPQAWITVVYV